MKTFSTQALGIFIVAAALTVGFGSSTAQAQTRVAPELDGVGGVGSVDGVGALRVGIGGVGIGRPAPDLGINSHFIPGFGLFVMGTNRYSEAERLTLEPHDMIVKFNGRPLAYAGALEDEARAVMGRGYGYSTQVTLTVRNCRTGRLIPITTDVARW